ncbi:MAG TPA: hypothetical protein GX708_03975 [Gallicola sp.]|nr:hypothetical protein [Gallicola sp.]
MKLFFCQIAVRHLKIETNYIQGLEKFIRRLKPKLVFVHGGMFADVFDPYKDVTESIHYESHTVKVFSEVENGHRI